MDPPPYEFLEEFKEYIFGLQKTIVAGLQEEETKRFIPHEWEREDGKGEGIACIIENGRTYEKAGVNVSALTINITIGIYKTMKGMKHFQSIKENEIDDYEMFACGLSLVVHPLNPHVPTTHCNYRVIVVSHKETKEVKDWWFGGGCDLTPIYLNVPDAIHFHSVLKLASDKHDMNYYSKFKSVCDDYFCIQYRKERRGIGGNFMENLND